MVPDTLAAVNAAFVREHVAHRWLDFTSSSDDRSHNEHIHAAALERRLQVCVVDRNSYFLDEKARLVGGLVAMQPSINGAMTRPVCESKEFTKKILQVGGLPVPNVRTFGPDDRVSARKYVNDRSGDRLVLKPIDGSRGLGVTTGVTEPGHFDSAWEKAANGFKSGRVLIEDEIAGVDIRVFVVGGHACAAIARVPPFVVGDGQSSLAQLVRALKSARQSHFYINGLQVLRDYEYLARFGVDNSTVLPRDQIQFLNGTANLSQGGIPVDVTDDLPHGAFQMAVDAASQVPDLAVAGVDLLMPDTQSIKGAVLLELNVSANLLPHDLPVFGKPRGVAGEIVDEMLRQFKTPHSQRSKTLERRNCPARGF